MSNKIFHLAVIVGVIALTFLAAGTGYPLGEVHLDRSKLPDGCSSCHKGHGSKGTAMLQAPKDELCFTCHEKLRFVILKRSNHPVVKTSQYHVSGERLPARNPSSARHVSCFDCHNSHMAGKDKPLRGVAGYSGRGMRVKEVTRDYEVCYLCHADSANLPATSSNMARKFNPGNASFHPVEAAGKSRFAPSLKRPLSTASTIGCSDCHGNDDRMGPKGPHGSNYDKLLTGNYNTDPGPESPNAYQLCYDCHNRNSILNDESFSSHKRHVLYGGISCFSCHDSHGSATYENLISFSQRLAFPNSFGQLAYAKMSPGKPRCFLNCHINGLTYDHKMDKGGYYINTNNIPGW
ncbi:MAG: cytochrome c3 family protein [Thermodesulfovibrionales bacterium]|jgi:predicted CXXCH cytochrome family protein